MELMVWIIYCFVDSVRQKPDPMPDVHIMYEDQPYCDFKSLFLMANGGYVKQTLSYNSTSSVMKHTPAADRGKRISSRHQQKWYPSSPQELSVVATW